MNEAAGCCASTPLRVDELSWRIHTLQLNDGKRISKALPRTRALLTSESRDILLGNKTQTIKKSE